MEATTIIDQHKLLHLVIIAREIIFLIPFGKLKWLQALKSAGFCMEQSFMCHIIVASMLFVTELVALALLTRLQLLIHRTGLYMTSAVIRVQKMGVACGIICYTSA